MVFARVVNFFAPGQNPPSQQNGFNDSVPAGPRQWSEQTKLGEDEDSEAARPPLVHAMLAGGLGGTTGDMLMHSLDTVKTRQQGDPHMPPKYGSMSNTYYTIFRQEGLRRGLYGGVAPAFLGSFMGTVAFFGTYEWSKRHLVDMGITPSISYFTAGLIADLAAAPIYVPSEVLKTRLQLQGRYMNPHFNSGYNYRSTTHAIRTIVREEGFSALYYGFRATLWRDLPYSALQFAFYEQEQKAARVWIGSRDIGLAMEILTGASAGCLAGVMTCPFDVVKTRLQTQHNPEAEPPSASTSRKINQSKFPSATASTTSGLRPIHGTPAPESSAANLNTSSMIRGLAIIYKTEGLAGWFRGVGPRAVWTSVQSGAMFVLYQTFLRVIDRISPVDDDIAAGVDT